MALSIALASGSDGGIGLLGWVTIGVVVGILAAVLWLVSFVAIVTSRKHTVMGKAFWIFGTLPWPILGPLAYLLVGRVFALDRDVSGAPPAATNR